MHLKSEDSSIYKWKDTIQTVGLGEQVPWSTWWPRQGEAEGQSGRTELVPVGSDAILGQTVSESS